MRRSLAKALLWRAFAMGNALTMIALLFGKNLDVAIFTAMVHFDGGESKLNIIDSSVFEQPPIKQHGNDNKDAPSLPSGQQLLVNIKNVDYQFLSSGVQIAKAMAYLLEEFPDARPLSSHCHSLVHVGEGVSCFVLSSDGHISVRSWPAEGVIIVDLFIRGASTLSIPVLLLAIKRLFAIASLDSEDECSDVHLAEPKILWSHKLRGFREGFSPGYRRYGNPLETDVGLDTLRMHYLDKKEVLTSRTTKFQHVDIYEVINPRVNSLAWYERSLSDNGSYESIHPEMYRPDRVLYLDGVQQSSLYGDAAYHEALVHPSMIAHPNPQRVAIIGGGEGATLREVLKHNTVKKVVMIEIDEELVALCREYLPEWSNCADLVGSDATSCFDDSRVTVSFEDAFAWFVKNFGSGKNRREQFDIIIMDALDPDHYVEIVGALYNNDQFVHSLYHGLTEEGVFVVQMGEASESDDPSLEIGPTKDAAHMASARSRILMAKLESAGFGSMHGYDEGHSGFYAPWSYIVCFKDSKSRASWYETSAGIDIKLQQRLHKTKSGKLSLLYFDASTMLGYQLPAKVDETVYCRKVVKPWECEDNFDGLDPKIVNPISNLDHKRSKAKFPTHYFNGTIYSPLFERRSRQILL